MTWPGDNQQQQQQKWELDGWIQSFDIVRSSNLSWTTWPCDCQQQQKNGN